MIISQKKTYLVVTFLVLHNVTVPVYDFSPGTVFALINTSFLGNLFSTTVLLCLKICSSCFLILADADSSMMILLSMEHNPVYFH